VLIWRSTNVQLFGFTPRGHQEARRHGVGVATRIRARDRWRHLLVHAHWSRPDLRRGRGTLTFEVCSWLTGPGTHDRLRIKTFVRLKMGLGGPVASSKESQR
jgi:hypothetical protein